MDPIITQGQSAIYATFTIDAAATKDINLVGRKVLGVVLDSSITLGSATTVDIIPYGVGATSSNATITSIAAGKAYYSSSWPRLNRATIKFNAAVTGDVTLILE